MKPKFQPESDATQQIPAAQTAGRGRPEYRPTGAARHRVAVAAGAGMRHDDIALALGISAVTLRRHFQAELGAGAAQRRMETLDALFRAAKRGSASAAKAYLAHAPEPFTGPPAAREPSPPKRGKKQLAGEAAERAAAPGKRFAPGEPPLVVQHGNARAR